VERLTRNGRAANVVLHDGGHLDLAVDRGPSIAAAGLLMEKLTPSHKFVRLDHPQWSTCCPANAPRR